MIKSADHTAIVQTLLLRTWKETKAFWNPYRWWLSISPAALAVLLLGIRRGWGSLMNAGDVAINAIGGCALAFAGSWVISLVRSVKLLDDDRANDIAQIGERARNEIREASEAAAKQLGERDTEIQRLNLLVSKPPRSLAEEHHHQIAEREIRGLSEDATHVLRHVYAHGKLFAGPDGIGAVRLGEGIVLKCLNGELSQLKIVCQQRGDWDRNGQKIWWEIPPAYRDAVAEVLFRPVTPPPASSVLSRIMPRRQRPKSEEWRPWRPGIPS